MFDDGAELGPAEAPVTSSSAPLLGAASLTSLCKIPRGYVSGVHLYWRGVFGEVASRGFALTGPPGTFCTRHGSTSTYTPTNLWYKLEPFPQLKPVKKQQRRRRQCRLRK